MRTKLLRIDVITVLIGFSLFIAAFCVSAQASENDTGREIDAVWSQSDGIRPEIFYSHKVSGIWTEPVMITDDYHDNMYPVIDSDSSGRKWLFWTAYDNRRMEIHYTTGQDGQWSETAGLTTENQYNIAPSVIIDKNDVVWLVWSASNGKTEDIFYASNKDGVWTDAQPVHQGNNTPDVLPVIELNSDDLPVITWKNVVEGETIVLTSEWGDDGWSKPAVVSADEGQEQDSESSQDMVELPEFMPASGLVFLRVY